MAPAADRPGCPCRLSHTGPGLGAAAAAFNGVFIEGVEVVFIVLAVGAAGHKLLPATLGAAAAAVIVIVLGLIARRPLSTIPENALKLAVGVLVSAFGTFWAGEGLGLTWPGGDCGDRRPQPRLPGRRGPGRPAGASGDGGAGGDVRP